MDVPRNSGKKCNRCQAMLPFAEYGINRAMRDGLQSTCRGCLREARLRRALAEGRLLREPPPTVPAGWKWCPGCRQAKPKTDFYTAPTRADGLASACKPCSMARSRASQARRDEREGVVRRKAPPRAPGRKWCPDCQELRPLAEFYRNRSARDGLSTYCRRHQLQRSQDSIERLHGSGRHYRLRRRYGIGEDQYLALLAAQGGVCAACRIRPAVHVDHDHKTRAVRGLLCFTCNVALGNVRDDIDVLTGLINYLREHQCDSRETPPAARPLRSTPTSPARSPSGSEQPPLTSSPEEGDSQPG